MAIGNQKNKKGESKLYFIAPCSVATGFLGLAIYVFVALMLFGQNIDCAITKQNVFNDITSFDINKPCSVIDVTSSRLFSESVTTGTASLFENIIRMKLPAVVNATACIGLEDRNAVANEELLQVTINKINIRIPLLIEETCLDIGTNPLNYHTKVVCGCGGEDVKIKRPPNDNSKQIIIEKTDKEVVSNICGYFDNNPFVNDKGYYRMTSQLDIANHYRIYKLLSNQAYYDIELLFKIDSTDDTDDFTYTYSTTSLDNFLRDSTTDLTIIGIEIDKPSLRENLYIVQDLTNATKTWVIEENRFNLFNERSPSKPCFFQHSNKYLSIPEKTNLASSNLRAINSLVSVNLKDKACYYRKTEKDSSNEVKQKYMDIIYSISSLETLLTEQTTTQSYFCNDAFLINDPSGLFPELQLPNNEGNMALNFAYSSNFDLIYKTVYAPADTEIAIENVTCSHNNFFSHTTCEIFVSTTFANVGDIPFIASAYAKDSIGSFRTKEVFFMLMEDHVADDTDDEKDMIKINITFKELGISEMDDTISHLVCLNTLRSSDLVCTTTNIYKINTFALLPQNDISSQRLLGNGKRNIDDFSGFGTSLNERQFEDQNDDTYLEKLLGIIFGTFAGLSFVVIATIVGVVLIYRYRQKKKKGRNKDVFSDKKKSNGMKLY